MMELPFTGEAFFHVMARYNEAVWPVQWVLYAAGVGLAILPLARRKLDARLVFLPLAALWLWMALGYHWWFFRAINPAATVFALAFAAQSMLFLWAAWAMETLSFRRVGWRYAAGVLLNGYALLVYPALNMLLGDHYPEMVTFGLPCPTTILTLGLLIMLVDVPLRLVVIPFLWGLVGGSAAWHLGVEQDYGLLVAALLSLAVFSLPDPGAGGVDVP